MQPFIEQFWEYFKLLIDLAIVAIVLMSGFFQEQYLRSFRLRKNDRDDASFKTLLVSFVVSIMYIHLIHKADKAIPIAYAKYFMSYFAATSLYELLIKPFRRWIKKKTGDDTPDTENGNASPSSTVKQ